MSNCATIRCDMCVKLFHFFRSLHILIHLASPPQRCGPHSATSMDFRRAYELGQVGNATAATTAF